MAMKISIDEVTSSPGQRKDTPSLKIITFAVSSTLQENYYDYMTLCSDLLQNSKYCWYRAVLPQKKQLNNETVEVAFPRVSKYNQVYDPD